LLIYHALLNSCSKAEKENITMWIFLLLIILLLLLLWPVIRLALGYRKLRQHMSQAYRQQQYDNDSRQGRQRRQDSGDYDPATGRRKVYSESDGEYVDFEEVDNGRRDTVAAQQQACDTVVEEQVSDAEYEDIP
jgi:flagellar biosynthesis/type III secretory pathway M-ring protein FliF/YscJ